MRTRKSAEDRRAEIIQAAITLFNEKGFDKTTVEDITQKASIAKGSFYLHFQSKQEVLDACIGHLTEGLLATFSSFLADKSISPWGRLHSYIEYSFAQAQVHEDDALAKMLHAPAFADQHDRIMSESIRKMLPLFTELMEKGAIESGFAVSDAQTSAAAVLGALRQVHETLAHRQDLSLSRKKELTYEILSRLLGVDMMGGAQA